MTPIATIFFILGILAVAGIWTWTIIELIKFIRDKKAKK